jgi:AcrR family transcriptional regulator
MSATERRERERQAVRQLILDAARELARDEGWPAVTVRRVADRIDYTSPVIYQHFENKDALLAELRREGFAQLLAHIDAGTDIHAAPAKQLLAMVHAQVEFAFDNVQLYQVMFGFGGVACEGPMATPEARQLALRVHQAASRLVRARSLWSDDPVAAARALVGSLHGIIALHLEGMFEGGRASADRACELTARTMIASWQRAERPAVPAD